MGNSIEYANQKQDEYLIRYSNRIFVTKNGEDVGSYSYGVLHTEGFRGFLHKIKASGSKVLEQTDFYPVKKLFASPIIPKFDPRPYQASVRSIACSGKIYNGLFEAPTGSGKTNMIAYVIAELNVASIVIVPKSDLVEQTYQRFLSIFGISGGENYDMELIGRVGDGLKELGRPILITTWQSLLNPITLTEVLDYGYNAMFCDETHRASADKLSEFIDQFKSKMKFGFSASVYRSKKEQMDKIYSVLGNKRHSVSILDLYKDGFVLKPEILKLELDFNANIDMGIKYHYEQSIRTKRKMRFVMANMLFNDERFRVFRPKGRTQYQAVNFPSQEDITALTSVAIYLKNESKKEAENEERKIQDVSIREEMRKKRNSISLGLAKKGIDNYIPRQEAIMKSIVALLGSDLENQSAAILTNSIAFGEKIASALIDIGYNNVMLVNGSDKNKKEIIRQLSTGEINKYIVVSTVQFLSEGNDMPSLEKIFVGSPVYPPYTSMERLQQIIGRCVRPDKNNPAKSPKGYVYEDRFTDGIAAERKTEMWAYVEHAFQVNAIAKPAVDADPHGDCKILIENECDADLIYTAEKVSYGL